MGFTKNELASAQKKHWFQITRAAFPKASPKAKVASNQKKSVWTESKEK